MVNSAVPSKCLIKQASVICYNYCHRGVCVVQDMEVRNSCFSAFICNFTADIIVMIVSANPNLRECVLLSKFFSAIIRFLMQNF